MQEAILAQMNQDNEDIYIEDDEEGEEGQQNPGQGGLMSFISNLMWGGG